MPVHRRVTPCIKFTDTHLYTWVEGGIVRVKCLAQEHPYLLNPIQAKYITIQHWPQKQEIWGFLSALEFNSPNEEVQIILPFGFFGLLQLKN